MPANEGIPLPSQGIHQHEDDLVKGSSGRQAILRQAIILSQARQKGFIGKEAGGKGQHGDGDQQIRRDQQRRRDEAAITARRHLSGWTGSCSMELNH